MAIDDNTLYGLTGAQVKELPERIEAVKGMARVLTTDDYNYPVNNPTYVALWLLEPGIYVGPEGSSVATRPIASSSQSMGAGFPNMAIVLKSVSDSNQRGEVLWVDASAGVLRQYYDITASGSGSSRSYLRTSDIVNNLTSASTNTPLSAAQGKVLKDLIDAIVVPTQTSDLTNDGSDGTSTYVEADELATVATSGNYNDLSNTPTIPTVPTNVSAFTNDAGYQTASNVSSAVATETTARQAADANLQSQIDGISASSDVKDIVGTKAALNAYDTSTLGNNDIIKVLQDESQNNETTYYRWSTTTSTFTLIGEEGPYYTKSETDILLNAKANTSSLATVATSGSYNDLSNKPTIPTVNNATLTIQANGTTVNSFTANASSNVTANIPSATTSRYGVTELSSSTSSTSTTLAATPSAVKSAYDLANGKAKITMTSTDPGEGSTLAANNYVAVYGADALVQTADIADGAVTSGKIDFTTLGFGNYSTSEVDTGFTWINGKHIYKKTLQNTLSGSENSVDVSSCNIGTLIDWKNIVVLSTSQQIIGFRLGDDTSASYLMSGLQYNTSTKVLRFAFGSQYTGAKTVYSTIWYTKAS